MRRLIQLLACSALLAVTAAAQTSPAPAGEKVLKIYRFSWSEGMSWHLCDSDCGYQLPATMRYRYKNRPGHGQYTAKVVMKNVTGKAIKAVNVDFVFRETATEREFLTFHFRSERKVGPGRTKDIKSTVGRGKEPGDFSPAAPGEALLEQTGYCSAGTLFWDRKGRKLVDFREVERLRASTRCYYLPVVTRIEYEDGSVWEPRP